MSEGIRKVPLVSIGLPVYNGQNYLRNSLDSVLCQSFKDFELIISDNASTDATEKICREYASRDSRVRYHRNEENLGYAKNFNRVFEISSGTYFKWICHDDIIHPTFLEKCLKAFDGHDDIVGIYPGLAYIDDRGKVLERCNKEFNIMGESHLKRLRELMDYEIEGPDVFWGIYSLIRREALGRTSLHGAYVAADRVLLMELALIGKIKNINNTLLFIRKHPQSSMNICRLPKERYRWMNTGGKPSLVFPSWAASFQHYKTVRRYNTGFAQSLRAYFEVSRKIFKRDLRTLGGEIKVVAREWIGSR